jgi:hypothetical protein
VASGSSEVARRLQQLAQHLLDAHLAAKQRLPALVHDVARKDRFVVVARKGNPYTAGRLTLKRYVEAPHALVAPGGTPRGLVDDLLAERGLSRRIAVSVPHFLVAPQMQLHFRRVSSKPREAHQTLRTFENNEASLRLIAIHSRSGAGALRCGTEILPSGVVTMKMRTLGSSRLLLAMVLMSSACGGGDDGDDDDATGAPTSPSPRDAGVSTGMADAAASDPITGFINGLFGDAGASGITSLLGDGGLSGITALLGDGGLAGITSRFGDAGLGNFMDGGFDTSALCARAPQFCPDASATVRDAGSDAGGGASQQDAGAPDANGGGSSEAGSAGDASNAENDGSAEAGS